MSRRLLIIMFTLPVIVWIGLVSYAIYQSYDVWQTEKEDWKVAEFDYYLYETKVYSDEEYELLKTKILKAVDEAGITESVTFPELDWTLTDEEGLTPVGFVVNMEIRVFEGVPFPYGEIWEPTMKWGNVRKALMYVYPLMLVEGITGGIVILWSWRKAREEVSDGLPKE